MVVSIVLCFFVLVSTASAPPPPSWNDGVAKTAIVTFVRAVTDKKGKDDVAPSDRIAVFDNDGTLWSEQPLYFQFLFTAAGQGRSLVLIVHRNDADREFAYDRESSVGRLDEALDEATANNWIVVGMKSDWKRVFGFEK